MDTANLIRRVVLIAALTIASLSASGQATLPQTWANSNEWIGTTSHTVSFPTHWQCGATRYPSAGDYANTQAGLQAAVNDAETCRTATGAGTTIAIPAGSVFSGTAGLTLPQTATDTSTNFIVLQSSTPLPIGQTVCSHGIQDNVASSTQPGIRNPGCDGSSMSYQLGTTVTTVSGAFTLANGNTTNTSAYNDIASMYTIEQSNPSNANPVVGTADPDVNNVAPHHFAILNAELRFASSSYQNTVAPVTIGSGNETLTSQLPNHIHFAYDHIPGDWTDAPVSGGVAVGSPNGKQVLPNLIRINACISCSFMYNYLEKNLRPGGEGHGWAALYMQTNKFAHNWIEGGSTCSMLGGAATYSFTNFVMGQDIEDRANRCTYPYSWILANDAGFAPNSLMTTTGPTEVGVTLNLTDIHTAAMKTATVVNGGSGCNVNDVLTASQPNNSSNGTMIVTACAGSAVSTVTPVSGIGYTVASNLPTTGGAGTGATVNITSVSATGGITGVSVASPGSGYTASGNLTVVQGGASGGTVAGTVSSGAYTGMFVVSGTGYHVDSYVRKNCHEVKAATRYLFDGNICENVDNSGAQGGQVGEFTVTNGAAGILSDNYWITTTDLTITDNVFRNGGVGPIMGARASNDPNGGSGVSQPEQRIQFSNNLIYNVSLSNPGMAGQTTQYGWRLGGSFKGTDWNTSASSRDSAGNITQTLVGSTGQQQSLFALGDPVQVSGCVDTSFNTNIDAQGPPALTGTLFSGLTVVYNNGTIGSPTTTTGCVVNNNQGYARYVTFDHNTVVADQGNGINVSSIGTAPWMQARNITYKNSLILNSTGFGSPEGEGTATEIVQHDPSTLIFHDTFVGGRSTASRGAGSVGGACTGAACYTEYSDTHVATTPPTTIYLTPTNYCTTNDPVVESCAGVLGAMSTGTFPIALSDWHNYRLCKATDAACNNKASIYSTGQANQATDGTDLGANLTSINAAQIATIYPGGFSDIPLSSPSNLSITVSGSVKIGGGVTIH